MELTDEAVYVRARVLADTKIPVNSEFRLVTAGLMGEREMSIITGNSDRLVAEGDTVRGLYDEGTSGISKNLSAQSTYFYVKKDRTVSGKNEATGDTIHIMFDPKKNAVKSLRLMGRTTNASGRYIDMEKYQRIKDNAKRDSLAKLDSLSGKNPKPGLTAEERANFDKIMGERKLRGLLNRRKDKATQTPESAKAADTTNVKKTEDAQ